MQISTKLGWLAVTIFNSKLVSSEKFANGIDEADLTKIYQQLTKWRQQADGQPKLEWIYLKDSKMLSESDVLLL